VSILIIINIIQGIRHLGVIFAINRVLLHNAPLTPVCIQTFIRPFPPGPENLVVVCAGMVYILDSFAFLPARVEKLYLILTALLVLLSIFT
jgi:hypothetical protein